MSEKEALELLDYACLVRSADSVEIRTLANGECVLVVKKSNYFCWGMADWLQYLQSESDRYATAAG